MKYCKQLTLCMVHIGDKLHSCRVLLLQQSDIYSWLLDVITVQKQYTLFCHLVVLYFVTLSRGSTCDVIFCFVTYVSDVTVLFCFVTWIIVHRCNIEKRSKIWVTCIPATLSSTVWTWRSRKYNKSINFYLFYII
jgi:hypothetical protein